MDYTVRKSWTAIDNSTRRRNRFADHRINRWWVVRQQYNPINGRRSRLAILLFHSGRYLTTKTKRQRHVTLLFHANEFITIFRTNPQFP